MFSHNTLLATALGTLVLAFAPGVHAASAGAAYEQSNINGGSAQGEFETSGGSVYKEREIYAKRRRVRRAGGTWHEAGMTPPPQRNYIGLDIGQFGTNQDLSSSGTHGTVLIGQLGIGINDFLSLELRGGLSVNGISTASDATRIVAREWYEVAANPDAYLDLFWGAYARANLLRVSPSTSRSQFAPYLMLGYTRATISAVREPSTTEDASSTENVLDTTGPQSISYGLGATLVLKSGVSFSVEYMRYFSESDFSIEGVTLGMNWRWKRESGQDAQ